MTDPVDFELVAGGEPNLGDQEGAGPDPLAEGVSILAPVVGWTAQEAAKVVGGLVANLTLALYAFKHQAPPPAELWPYIAGHPEQEFPLMGAGLAPVLDFVAPKGSAAAVGVSLTAGAGELIGAFARRAPIINTPPPEKARPAGSAPSPAAQPSPAPAGGEARGFRFSGEALRVLQPDEGPLPGVGIS